LSEPILRKQKFLAIFCLSWAAVCSTSAHAGIMPQHAPVLGAAPVANTITKSIPTSAAVLIGDANLGGPEDFLFTYDKAGINYAGAIQTSPVGDATKLTVPLSSIKTGWYASHWNVQSADGHMAGGDDGLWWAFGVKAKTPTAKSVKITLRSSVPVAPLPDALSVTLNGRRVGMRTLTTSITSARVTSFRFFRTNDTPDSLRNASFTWPVSYNKKTKMYSSTGIIPFAGTYTVTAQITSTNAGVTRTALWSSDVIIAN
jgi:methionine-rich copper-binding protein CopC